MSLLFQCSLDIGFCAHINNKIPADKNSVLLTPTICYNRILLNCQQRWFYFMKTNGAAFLNNSQKNQRFSSIKPSQVFVQFIALNYTSTIFEMKS